MLGVGTMLMLFLVFDSNQLLTKALNMRWLRLTGIVSFEWFLFHGPIFDLFREYTPEHSGGNALIYACKTILPMLVTFGIAVFVYRYFSLPILHWARDRIKAQAKAGS
jgi:peptidoglycan/LPS O-acetylase OafA/YrhL